MRNQDCTHTHTHTTWEYKELYERRKNLRWDGQKRVIKDKENISCFPSYAESRSVCVRVYVFVAVCVHVCIDVCMGGSVCTCEGVMKAEEGGTFILLVGRGLLQGGRNKKEVKMGRYSDVHVKRSYEACNEDN